MTAVVLKLNTANTTNLTKIKGGPGVLKGYALYNTSGASIFVKFYWSNTEPVVGTTVPDIAVLVPTVGQATEFFPGGITDTGEFYFAVTLLATDADATAVAAGAGILSIFYE